MKLILSFLLLLYSPYKAKPLYRAIFRTEISTTTKLTFKSLEPKSKEDSMLLEFSKQFMDNLETKKIFVTVTDSLSIFSDSTIIISRVLSSQVSDFPNSSFKSKSSTLILKDNKLFAKEEDGRISLIENNRNAVFQRTGEKETILDYTTNKYINSDSTISIWCCEKLPYLFNPGILVNDPKGGILKYEIFEEGQKITSIAEKIIK